MPALPTTATVSTTREVKLAPKLRAKLRKELRAYAALKEQLDVLKHTMEKHKAVIGELREETGEQSLQFEGYTVTLVAGLYKKFNPKKFVSLGGDLAIYNQAVEEKPKKAYEKISVPGSGDEGYAE